MADNDIDTIIGDENKSDNVPEWKTIVGDKYKSEADLAKAIS